MSDAVLNHTESAGVSRHQSCLVCRLHQQVITAFQVGKIPSSAVFAAVFPFSTSVQPCQLIQPAVAGQHSLAFFPWLTEKQVDEGSLFSGPYQDNKAFENSNPPLKDP